MTNRQFRHGRGPGGTILLILLTLAVILAGITFMRDGGNNSPSQTAQQGDSHAFYIAQTALDRTIKELVSNPKWRDGFNHISFENGTYDVRIYDPETSRFMGDNLPPNYVRIVASSEVNGMRREVEAVWVSAMSAFDYAYAAGNRIDIENHGAGRTEVSADLHNNSWDGGTLRIHSGTTVFGSLTSVGSIRIGDRNPNEQTHVYGDIWGSDIHLQRKASMFLFSDLSEWTHGIDLNGDGDTQDISVTRGSGRLIGKRISVDGKSLIDDERHLRVAEGTLGAEVGRPTAGPIVDPRPDFVVFYELVTGTPHYPPATPHVTTPISGDGNGHYFRSADVFIEWLENQMRISTVCWRCAGDGQIDPGNTLGCPNCNASGENETIEVSGVFYIDDAVLDLSNFPTNIIIHGTIVVASGNPDQWPSKEIKIPSGTTTIDHFPTEGRFILGGTTRPHFTQTYRSDEEGGLYTWEKRFVHAGENTQTIPILEPDDRHAMREFASILSADVVEITPRRTGFASTPGDIGDERLTILQGIVYAENRVEIHGSGGWNGGTIMFDETLTRAADDVFDERVLQVDLNDDGDLLDDVAMKDVSGVPVIPVGKNLYNVDINNDGVLRQVVLGNNYLDYFVKHDYQSPVLTFHRGMILSQSIHTCEQVLVVHDPGIAEKGVPFGFIVHFGATTYQGLVSWFERGSSESTE